MMSKIKSRGAAKLKLLLIVPMAAFLLLAFAEPKSAETQVADNATLSADQDTDQEKEEELKKKKTEQVKVLLTDLKKEEMILRKKMDATDDPEKKAQIKSHLKEVLTEEKFLADALANGEFPPPPPKNEKKLKQEYKMLSEKADAIRAKMDKIANAKEKSEMKASLVEVMKKQDKIKAYLAGSNGSNGVDLKIDELKKEYNMLEEKAEELRKQIKNTDDPDVKAKCKQMLSDIQGKQWKIKEKAESLKDGKEGKKIK